MKACKRKHRSRHERCRRKAQERKERRAHPHEPALLTRLFGNVAFLSAVVGIGVLGALLLWMDSC